MRSTVSAFAALVLAGCAHASPSASVESSHAIAAAAPGTPRVATDGVAVVELFTSEGCSSCPPADAVLESLGDDPRVFPLAFHVDYWDGLGWHDPFSSTESTSRQRSYALAFGEDDLYTPQVVVAGVEAFVGSDRARVAGSVEAALARGAPVRLSMAVRAAGPNQVAIHVDGDPAPPAATLNIAAVERAVTTVVRAGENAGRTLHHVNVVRAFLSRPWGERDIVLDIPSSLAQSNAEILAYVQIPGAPHGMPVLGATRVSLPSR